jgi:hypothetical protein
MMYAYTTMHSMLPGTSCGVLPCRGREGWPCPDLGQARWLIKSFVDVMWVVGHRRG